MSEDFRFKLNGPTLVCIDWANVYGWQKSVKGKIDYIKIFEYLKTYKEISDIHLYFGKDKHPKSEKFLNNAKKTGYRVITKPVKYLFVAEVAD